MDMQEKQFSNDGTLSREEDDHAEPVVSAEKIEEILISLGLVMSKQEVS